MQNLRPHLETFMLEIFACIDARFDGQATILPPRRAEVTRLARDAAQRFRAGWSVPGCALNSEAEVALWLRVFNEEIKK